MSAELLMLVPSRGRPQSIKRLYREFLDTTEGNTEFLALVDDDDCNLDNYKEAANELGFSMEVGPRLRLGGTLNVASSKYAPVYPFIGWVGDDTVLSTPQWDVKFVTELKRLGTGMAYGNDLLQCGNIPAALITMTSNIVLKLGYMAVPGFQHMYLDNAWQAWGDGIGKITYFPEVIHEHLHFSASKSQMDQTYAESDPFMSSDAILWNEYVNSGQLDRDIAKLKELL
jgi:hypothetical protein